MDYYESKIWYARCIQRVIELLWLKYNIIKLKLLTCILFHYWHRNKITYLCAWGMVVCCFIIFLLKILKETILTIALMRYTGL